MSFGMPASFLTGTGRTGARPESKHSGLRRSSHPAQGVAMVPRKVRRARTGAIAVSLPSAAPAMTSLCPPMNFVAE